MDYLDALIEKDRQGTYRTRKMLLEDLIEGSIKTIKTSNDPEEIKHEAINLVDYRLQLIDVNKNLEN
ncbi:hypothetical protein DM469_00325 [Lactobacillus helveticus]|uniref:Uncharacterized protein n=1 Tax=Lactobacillus helveticus TaxID=1587 RepID=A0AAU8XSN9_LACHE|nr:MULTISPECIES: hypothetical protein [Lactobacillus]AUI73823.1 hypothetical protein Lh8105_02655 [Lactobacillus helveticus]MCO0806679.1 hypothetical protein [Lactobacillus helveticus]MDB6265158.1 hypothetical protein [Lactobacillus amylovorus]NRO05202.1 hypothetical protein [Lactobacillus helveticus]PXZ15166.1 hypothetical protein DM470_00630 [Lactobacillus helveticus]